MVSEDYVSYEVAKLLKEKGFDQNCATYYLDEQVWHHYHGEVIPKDKQIYAAPTQAMAMKWLREVHHMEIFVTCGFPVINGKQQYKHFWSIVKVCNNYLEFPMDDPNSSVYNNEEMADSYEQAIEEAIKYCLEHLI